MHPTPADGTAWAQYIIVSAGALAVFIGTLFSYIHKGKSGSRHTNDVAVVSATFADRRTIESLADSMARLERAIYDTCEESRRVREESQRRRDHEQMLLDAVKASTDAQVNMVKFLEGRVK